MKIAAESGRAEWPGRLARLGLLVMLGAGAGCPPSTPPTRSPAVVAEPPARATLGDDAFVQAVARGATEDEAYAAAERALAEAVLGDPSWATLASMPVHRRGADLQQVVPSEGGFEVAVGLTRARAAEIVSDFENAELEAGGPPMWRDALVAYLRAHLAAQACVRRTALFQATCETGDTQSADEAVASLGEGLLLVSAYPDGIPVDPQGRPLREPVVFTLWRGVPLAGLPLRIEAADASALAATRLVSDAQGRVRVPLAEGAALPSMRVMVDAEALLGPRSAEAPRAELEIEPRAVGVRRWAVLTTRAGAGHAGDQAEAALARRMSEGGLGTPVELGSRDAKALRSTPPAQRGARLKNVADAMSGRIDLLLTLDYRTRFASRMGGGRVWYEAEGTLRVLDAWTGEVRAEASGVQGAEGVGDDAADAAARTALGKALATEVLGSLKR